MIWKWKRQPKEHKSKDERQRVRTQEFAYKLYQNRLRMGRVGDDKSDWDTAQKIARNPLRLALFVSNRPLIRLEKDIWEPLLEWANNQALLTLLGIVGNIGIIIAVITYIGTEKQRRDAEILNAWQTITSAHGQSGNGGRIRALEFLNASPGANWRRKFPWFCSPHPLCTWSRESLQGINLSVDVAKNISSVNKNEEIVRTTGVYLRGIELPYADLEGANLERADLWFANLEGADLVRANLEGAYLVKANLEGASLLAANLEGANVGGANLEKASLEGANLEGASLLAANLEGASLREANLEGASLREANLEKAKVCQTILPENLTVDSNRDCEELDIDIDTH